MEEKPPITFGDDAIIQEKKVAESIETTGIRADVIKKINELGNALELLLRKDAAGERVMTKEGEGIVDKIYDIVDSCLLFSEYRRAGEIFDNFEKQYPKAVEKNFKDMQQHNPVPGLQTFIRELKIPFEGIHKTKKGEKYLGCLEDNNTERSTEEYQEMLGITSEDIKGQRILDIGAGSNNFAKWAKQNNADVVSIDSNSTTVDAQADWRHLPFKDESFDRAVSVFAFPVWVKNWEELKIALKEIIRVVKKGGIAQFIPGAPVLDKGDFDSRTRNKWMRLEFDMRDTIHWPEFEKLLERFDKEVEISFGKPQVDLYSTHSVEFTPLILKKR